MPDKEEDYGLAAHKREVAIRELMTVPSRPGVWTDLVIAGPVDSFKIGITSMLTPDCLLVQRTVCVTPQQSDSLWCSVQNASSFPSGCKALGFRCRRKLCLQGGAAPQCRIVCL